MADAASRAQPLAEHGRNQHGEGGGYNVTSSKGNSEAYLQQPPEWVDWLIQGVRVTSGKVTKADELVAAAQAQAHAAIALAKTGEFANAGNPHGNMDNIQVTSVNGGGGTSAGYLAARLKKAGRDDLLKQIGPGKKHQSVRSAAIEAGIITPFPSLQLKDPAPTAQKPLAKKGRAWHHSSP